MVYGPNQCVSCKKGFIALFFVLAIAISLAGFVFTLSQSFGFSLMLLDSYRQGDNPRSSALYCMYRLKSRMTYDPLYTPEIGFYIPSMHGGVCRYTSFFRDVTSTNVTVVIEGLGGLRGGLQRDVRAFGVDGNIGGNTTVLTRHLYRLETVFDITKDISEPILGLRSRQIL